MISSRMWWISRRASAMVLASAAVVTGCVDLIGVDWSSYQQTGGAANSGGGGSAGSGGASVTTSGAGAGNGGVCMVPEDCPGQDTPCQTRTCEGGLCGLDVQPGGVPAGEQTPGDCRAVVCDGAGATTTIEDDGDALDDGKDCTIDTCDAGMPTSMPAPVDASCNDGGGQLCDGMGNCVKCLTDADCSTATPKCSRNLCVPASCIDGVQNGTETDLDCGGACGATCLPDESCQSAGDCVEGVCNVNHVCTWPDCSDGLENGTETDIDCGGACAALCGPNEGCNVNADCTGNQCSGVGGVCVPNCDDAVQNGAETGVDCGGGTCDGCAAGQPCDQDNDCVGTAYCDASGTCKPKGTNGTTCLGNNECTSALCVDGYCCSTACNGTCQACNLAGSAGICTAVPGGTDPGNECTGNSGTDVCNGAGACKEVNGTPCSSAGECLSALCVDGVCCNSTCSSTCQACNLASSLGACTNVPNGHDPASECAGVTSCNGSGACTKLANGSVCTQNGECSSSYCVDGMCCNTSCAGTCQACAGAKTGWTNGTCAYITAATDPDNECPNNGANDVCNGAGACKEINGTPCFASSECLTGYCADGFCCNTSCSGACQACSAAKNGGTSGACGNITAATDPDNECAGVTTCNGAGTCTKLSTGSACTLSGECSSGYCIDGVCCSTSCTGTCMACSAAKTGGANGTCAVVPPNADPDNECLGGDCNGVGVCELPAGMPCSQGSQCISGACHANVCGCMVELSVGSEHACTVKALGFTRCWGRNDQGQVGKDWPTHQYASVQIDSLWTYVVELAAGSGHTCAREFNGKVRCWGANESGQVGDDPVNTPKLSPFTVISSNTVEITAGGSHTCARKSDNSVWCWGANSAGQLGVGSTTNQPAPVQTLNMVAVEITAGGSHTCARKSNDSVWCWGSNSFGQLGIGAFPSQSEPVEIIGMTAVELTAGSAHTCARKADNSVWCWGNNNSGQLGSLHPTSQSTPVPVAGMTAVEITAGGSHTCARKSDNSVWCWGYNSYGQVGTGSASSYQLTPVPVASFEAIDIEAGGAHTCARKPDGTVWCWGKDDYGQTGDGMPSTYQPSPVQVTPTLVCP